MLIVIGIGGMKGTGKVTLAKLLRAQVEATIPVGGLPLGMWKEIEENYFHMDMKAIYNKLTVLASEEESKPGIKFVVITGRNILNCREIGDLCDLKIYLTLTKVEFLRRLPLSRCDAVQAEHVEDVVWPAQVAHWKEVERLYPAAHDDDDDVVYLDGTVEATVLLFSVMKCILHKLKEPKRQVVKYLNFVLA